MFPFISIARNQRIRYGRHAYKLSSAPPSFEPRPVTLATLGKAEQRVSAWRVRVEGGDTTPEAAASEVASYLTYPAFDDQEWTQLYTYALNLLHVGA